MNQTTTPQPKVQGETPRGGNTKNIVFIIIALIGASALFLMFTAGNRAEAPTDEAPEEMSENNETDNKDSASTVVSSTEVVSLYFVRVENGTEEFVRVTRTIPSVPGIARATLTQLLAGPTPNEVAQGLGTALPDGVVLQDIRIENGTAYADFNAALEEGIAGSALVGAIRGQIERTLLQFPTVSRVVISIDGESEGILQP